MRLNNKSGFTLLEIIIVIIIVGVLASLALPRLFDTIEFSRSTEALEYMGHIKRGADRCAMMNGLAVLNFANCATVPATGYQANPANSHFSYNVTLAGAIYTITAARTAMEGGNIADRIIFTYNTATGVVAKAGTGAFAGIN